MKKPYPLKLEPVIKDYLWGGERLITEYNMKSDTDIAAEGWMLACHKDGTNRVQNGAYAGARLTDVLQEWGMGATRFPLMIKLIDAKDKLSVQVHPNDAYAFQHEGEPGKTEMWYVVDCKPGARLIYGFNRVLEQEEFARRIRENTLDEVMNYVPVKKGDVFFIGAGTLHAIGEGILIAEIQQNSNTTYRVSDHGRVGADGKPRELHVDKALAVTTLAPATVPFGRPEVQKTDDDKAVYHLADCEYFWTDLVELEGKIKLEEQQFVSVLCLSGEAVVQSDDEEISLGKGESVFVPADVKTEINGRATLILSAEKKLHI